MSLMKDSRLADQWIANAIARNPIQKLPNGSIATCPVRLSFPNIFKKQPARRLKDGSMSKEAFNAILLFPPGAQAQIDAVLWPEWYQAAKEVNPKNFDPQGQPINLHWPIHDCRDMQQYAGFTPGLPYLAVSTDFKPMVLDPAQNPIVDDERVYPGVWAIVGLNCYGYNNMKKGAGFGLQHVMLIADDQRLAGAGPDPAQLFGHVQIDAQFDPAAAFAAVPGAPPPPPPASIMPPPRAVAPPAPPLNTVAELDYDPMEP